MSPEEFEKIQQEIEKLHNRLDLVESNDASRIQAKMRPKFDPFPILIGLGLVGGLLFIGWALTQHAH